MPQSKGKKQAKNKGQFSGERARELSRKAHEAKARKRALAPSGTAPDGDSLGQAFGSAADRAKLRSAALWVLENPDNAAVGRGPEAELRRKMQALNRDDPTAFMKGIVIPLLPAAKDEQVPQTREEVQRKAWELHREVMGDSEEYLNEHLKKSEAEMWQDMQEFDRWLVEHKGRPAHFSHVCLLCGTAGGYHLPDCPLACPTCTPPCRARHATITLHERCEECEKWGRPVALNG